jgi:polyphosphate kinase
VRSILGRFLEHSRIYHFVNGGEDEYWVGSADLMHRNLDRRVESLVRIERPAHKSSLQEIFDISLSEETSSWHQNQDRSGSAFQRIQKVNLCKICRACISSDIRKRING